MSVKTQKKKSKALFIFLIACIIGLSLIVITVQNNRRNISIPMRSAFDDLMAIDFDRGYPAGPREVVYLNNRFMGYLYGGSIAEENIRPILAHQRNLFSNQLLELTDFELQVETATQEILDLRQRNERFIGFETGIAVYNRDDFRLAHVDVIQFTNTSTNNSIRFNLINEGGRYKIYSWGFTGDADINSETGSS